MPFFGFNYIDKVPLFPDYPSSKDPNIQFTSEIEANGSFLSIKSLVIRTNKGLEAFLLDQWLYVIMWGQFMNFPYCSPNDYVYTLHFWLYGDAV